MARKCQKTAIYQSQILGNTLYVIWISMNNLWKCRCGHRNMNVASKSFSSNCNNRVYRNSFLPFLSFLSFHDLSPRFCNLEPIVSFLHSFLLLLHSCINCDVEQQNYYLKRDYLAIFCISFYWQRGPAQKKEEIAPTYLLLPLGKWGSKWGIDLI